MPWHESASAILLLFLGGEQTGSAWGAVLFGDHAPTGRLPLVIPRSEDDTIPPLDGDEITYTEGLLTSYRNPDLDPLFPFGHGLTYSTFKYGAATGGKCGGTTPTGMESVLCIQVSVENEGPVPARCIPQLYIEFPSEAGYSVPILRGFQRTELLDVGAKTTVTFALSMRELSYWDVDEGDWTAVAYVDAHIGESFGDIRQKLEKLDILGQDVQASAPDPQQEPVETEQQAAPPEPQGHSDPYDCEAGFSNWEAGWSENKKAWCCEHAQRGCEQEHSDPYDCNAGFSNWEAGWSESKKAWCCQQCAVTAIAAPDSVCGASQADCEACGGGSTWCPGDNPVPVAE